MEGTIATRAAESQRARDGLRSFFRAQGAAAISGTPAGAVRAGVRPRPSEAEIREAGEIFLASVFGPDWESKLPESELVDAVLATPIDNAWLARRLTRLRPMSDGPMRLIPKAVWNLSTVLAQADWFEVWMHFAQRCPRDWLVQFCGVAMLNGQGELRSIDTRRVQSMLSLGVLAWQLAEYDPSDPQYPYIIRGLPYGAWRLLVAYWMRYPGRAELRVPSANTLFGTHEVGGRWDRAECGYIAAWKQAGIATTSQPSGYNAAPRHGWALA